jgi:hypothetical protein
MVALVLVLFSLAVAQEPPKLDGNWWLSIADDQRVEFLAGYMDCYAADVGDYNRTLQESWYTYAPKITRYYADNPKNICRRATRVLFDVRSKNPPQPLKGGEIWTEKHGPFNGEYWREMKTPVRIAFVEGYLACLREHLPSRAKRFSKAAQTYSDEVSRWYGIDAADRASPKLIDVPIADALYEIADSKP